MTKERYRNIFPFVLCGGDGTRLWPLSRPSMPKQFLNLISDVSLLQQTLMRLDEVGFRSPHVLCNEHHRFVVAEQIQCINIDVASIILEPVAKNTGPATLIATLETLNKTPDGLVLLLPSDHLITLPKKMALAIEAGIDAAQEGNIVTFGTVPISAHTGYGYIETENVGTDNVNAEAMDVVCFSEKPNLSDAKKFTLSKKHFWNTGIYLFSAKCMLQIFSKLHPDMTKHCRSAISRSKRDMDFLRLEEEAYSNCDHLSLDYGIVEKIDNIKCVPMDAGWNDLGEWPSIWAKLAKDVDGNTQSGDVVIRSSKNCFAHSRDGACLTMIGIEDVMAIATKDAILISSREHVHEIKAVVAGLEKQGRSDLLTHDKIYRPWGWYLQLDTGKNYKVKCLMIKPGASLSLQSHNHRAEHWVVVEGEVEVTREFEKYLVRQNQATYIPVGAKHRVCNTGTYQALLIEVQSGTYLAEDDIVRYEDVYGRVE